MRILIHSPAFLPHVGGLEYNMATLAGNLHRLGEEVVVITKTPGGDGVGGGYRVVRSPGPLSLLRWVRWCEVFHHANVSLQGLWPLLFVHRAWTVSHHGMYRRGDGQISWRDRLKRHALRWADASVAVSTPMAADLEVPSVVIPNAYRDHLFRHLEGIERANDLLFVGRLVSDKGVACLLEAMAHLRVDGLMPALTIVGDGPEEPALRAEEARLGLTGQVRWLGPLRDEALVEEMNRHAVLAVPSLWPEPFGIVALEGIACGCVVVGSEGGGLVEAIGPCGLTFPNGNSRALAAALERALGDEALRRRCEEAADLHLAAHSPETQTARYREQMVTALVSSKRRRGRDRSGRDTGDSAR